MQPRSPRGGRRSSSSSATRTWTAASTSCARRSGTTPTACSAQARLEPAVSVGPPAGRGKAFFRAQGSLTVPSRAFEASLAFFLVQLARPPISFRITQSVFLFETIFITFVFSSSFLSALFPISWAGGSPTVGTQRSATTSIFPFRFPSSLSKIGIARRLLRIYGTVRVATLSCRTGRLAKSPRLSTPSAASVVSHRPFGCPVPFTEAPRPFPGRRKPRSGRPAAPQF